MQKLMNGEAVLNCNVVIYRTL